MTTTRSTSAPFDAALSKPELFRAQLAAPGLSFLMEAHNALAARIVEETGFPAIWASGLTISASLGVRDSNEASWTQILEVLEFMADATDIPILFDGDTGFGNFNNFRRLVQKLCARDVAAVCIEDKLFPKTNSFIGERQPLADIEEFSAKIKAGKDSQPNDNFSVIARVEALISGWGLDEAIRRAEAYHAAGADGILIHSKQAKPDEILAFAREWAARSPLVIVPTTYYAAPTRWFEEAGVSAIIWANHNLRAAMTAMRHVSRQIFEEQTLVNVEGEVATVRDIFHITGNDELRDAEERYLAKGERKTAIVLAASRGRALEALTADRPKCMIEIQGQSVLRRLVSSFNACAIGDVTVVRGYKKEVIDLPSLNYVDNDQFDQSGEAASLHCASEFLRGECVVSFGDVLFRKYILDLLLDCEDDIVLAVDHRWGADGDASPQADDERSLDLVQCDAPATGDFLEANTVKITGLDRTQGRGGSHGRWIGLARFSAAGSAAVKDTLAAMEADGSLKTAEMRDVFERLRAGGQALHAIYVSGNWLDINETPDVISAGQFLSSSRPGKRGGP